ncbi:MAG: hypothetical protein A2Y77_10295 [Planctomycetes bacterium RBG_13_62_9]|nr:MAG: hypothetical protein A2Y77_10295 [Planctomycetes bacterium RBG_13_62_9]
MKSYLLYGTILAAVAGLSLAAPRPAIVQRPGQWTLEVKYEQPQQMVLPWGVNGETRFWYMIVTVTNRTGQDVDFYPKCDLMTDTFQIVPAGRGVSPVVFERIKQRHQGQYPLLEPLQGVANRILEGEDNAKDIAIIWQDFDLRASSFQVFVSGLSNETAVVPHPVAVDQQTGRPVPVYLRKTLELSYGLRGDPSIRPSVEVVYKNRGWVMR